MKTVREVFETLYYYARTDEYLEEDKRILKALSELRELVSSLKHKPQVDGGGELQECECERCGVIAEVMELFK